MKWLCKFLGHKYNPVDVLLLDIKNEAFNRNELDLSIICSRCGSRQHIPNKTSCATGNFLTQKDTAFILWCFGYLLGQSDTMDQAHKKFIQENHDRVLSKIAKLHEDLK